MSFFDDLLGGIFGAFGGGGGGGGEPNWEDIARLMELDTTLNRTDRTGIFSSWEWEEGEDGTFNQVQKLAPGMQQGADRLMARASGGMGFEPYQSPEQFALLQDAKSANMMDRHNVPGWGIKMPDEGYGPRSRFRDGRFAEQYERDIPEAAQWMENPNRVAWQPPPPPNSRTIGDTPVTETEAEEEEIQYAGTGQVGGRGNGRRRLP